MDRWIGKVAVVTGASSGIGAAIAKDLAKAGMITVGLDLKADTSDLKKSLSVDTAVQLHSMKCDVTSESDIEEAFKRILETFGGVDVLVNNAGIARSHKLLERGHSSNIRASLETNVLAVVLCSQLAYQSMVERSVGGHIVNINSIVGHSVPHFPGLNIYPATKHAVTAITETMRQEMRDAGTKIKVTSISPGIVLTDILDSANIPRDMPHLQTEDIAQAVMYAIGTPPHVQVHEITLKPIGEPL